MTESAALEVARGIAGIFGKVKDAKDANPTRIEQLAFVSPQERAAALALADQALAGEKIDAKAAGLLRTADTAADIALFGRMLAADPDYNREAAAQVAHAITTHKVTVEDDYYTAVDDLKTSAEDAGAGFLGEAAFGSGVFYLYLCVDRALLLKNLGGEAKLAATALGALAEATATVAPRGKQNSFAAHGRAHYILAERGDRQPRTLAGAFARPVTGDDLMGSSIERLRAFRTAIDTAYEQAPEQSTELEVGGTGRLSDIVAFCRG
jgi:CRISPR system Cascade subunit CasC